MSGGEEGGGGGKLPSVNHGPRTEGGRDKNDITSFIRPFYLKVKSIPKADYSSQELKKTCTVIMLWNFCSFYYLSLEGVQFC